MLVIGVAALDSNGGCCRTGHGGVNVIALLCCMVRCLQTDGVVSRHDALPQHSISGLYGLSISLDFFCLFSKINHFKCSI